MINFSKGFVVFFSSSSLVPFHWLVSKMEKTKEILNFHKISHEFIPTENIENFYKTILVTDKVKEKVKKNF
jgi:DNA-directed RNA polymerase subunit H (RpoH/RPB5)